MAKKSADKAPPIPVARGKSAPGANGAGPKRRSGPPAPITPAGQAVELKTKLDSISPGLYQTHVQLSEMIGKRIKQDIGWNIQFARKLKNEHDKHGERGITALAKSLDMNRGYVSSAIQVATRFTDAEMQELINQQPAGRPLSWNHIVALSRLEDGSQRDQMVDKLVDEGLTVKDLQRRTRETFGKHSQGGRPFAMPKGLEGTIGGMESFATKFVNYAGTWEDHFKKLVDDIAADKVTSDMLTHMQATAENLHKVSEEAQKRAATLDSAVKRLNRKVQAAKPYSEDDAVEEFNKENPVPAHAVDRVRKARAQAEPVASEG